MANVVQLFVYRDPLYLSDIIEASVGNSRALVATLTSLGFDDCRQAQRDAEGDASFAELHVKQANDWGVADDGAPTETFRVVPAARPPRCRSPRACVELDGALVDAGAFVRARLK